jgi:gliding motility-associated-like protein
MHKIYCLFFIGQALLAQTVINEYSAANFTNYTDNYGDFEDWFELYNTDNSSQNLGGYYLSDKSSNLTKYKIPNNVQIESNAQLRFFASGRNVQNGNDLHTNFKIHQTKGNEWVILTAPDGLTVIDSVFVKPCLTNQSRGRYTDGAEEWGVFTNPSPMAANNNAFERYANTPNFSTAPGFYPSSVSVTLSTTEQNAEIYYTTDGSYPNIGSNLYTNPIEISATTVVKATTVSTNGQILNSFMEYGTFFINETFTMPVLSVSGDEIDELLSGDEIKPLGTFEYYKQNGELADKARGEFNEHGNDSWGYDQRGFDYITRDQLGYNYAIKDELFRTKNRNKYQRLIIKAAANDNYPFAYGGSGAHIRDSYVQSLSQIADLRMDERSFEPCILFSNGEYWGLYEIREKVDDKDFTDYYYDQDSVSFLKTWGGTWVDVISDGQTEQSVEDDWEAIRNYITSNDMSIPENYNYAKSVFNMGSLIDYFILNTYVVNADWLNWNTAWWHGLKEDGEKKKWRYVLWDMDNTFDHGANYTNIPDQNPDSDPCDPESLGDDETGGQGHVPIWNALLNNEEFFADYINRWTDLSNSYFSCDFLIGHLDSLIDIIEPEMPAQIEKWGGNYTTWVNNVQDMRDFITTRCEIINGGILNCYEDEFNIDGPYDVTIVVEPPLSGEISLNGFDLDQSPFNGQYFGGVLQEIEATANPNYTFDYWEFSNGTPVMGTSNTLEYFLNSGQTITAHFTPNNTLILPPGNEGTLVINGTSYTSFPDTIAVMETVSLEAIPDLGFLFDYWTISNGTIDDPTNPTSTATLLGNSTITAVYMPNPVLSVATNTVGTVVINGVNYNNFPQSIYLYGTNSIQAIAPVGYQFDYWTYNGENISNTQNTNTTIDIFSNAALKAHFSKIKLQVLFDISHPSGGTILLNNEVISDMPANKTVYYGDIYTIEIALNPNYLLGNWEIENSTNTTQQTFTLAFTENETITALLNKQVHLTVSVEPENAGIILGDGTELLQSPSFQTYLENTSINLEAIPELDYQFDYFVRNQGILSNELNFEYTIEHDDTLRVLFSEKELTLFIPNSFTPNADGLNDVFKPKGNLAKIKEYELLIFDSWGELVFQSNELNEGWNAQNIDYSTTNVFMYKITLRSALTNDRFEYKGTVSVL